MDISNLLISITLHISLLFIFLSILFWTVISSTESRSFDSELDKSIDNINYKQKVPKEVKDYLLTLYSNKNITQEKNNNLLLTMNISIIIVLIIVLITQVVFHNLCGGRVNYGEIILENIVILIIVGIIEFFFFKNIASRYIPVKPSYMTEVIKKSIDTA